MILYKLINDTQYLDKLYLINSLLFLNKKQSSKQFVYFKYDKSFDEIIIEYALIMNCLFAFGHKSTFERECWR